MRCEKVNSLMEEYLRGELEPKNLGEFEKHLAECTQCRSNLEVVKMLLDLANNELSKYNENPYFGSRILSKIEAQKENIRSDIRIRLVTYATVAAAVAMGIFIGNKLGNMGTKVITSTSDAELIADDYLTQTTENIYSFNIEDSENSNKK